MWPCGSCRGRVIAETGNGDRTAMGWAYQVESVQFTVNLLERGCNRVAVWTHVLVEAVGR